MSADNSERTVIKQPSVQQDRTVIRPTPGGRTGGQAPQRPMHTPLSNSDQAADNARQSLAVEHQTAQQNITGYFNTRSGLNPLVNAAATLIAVYEKTRQSLSHPNVGGLHQRLVSEIKTFDSNAQQKGIQPEIVLSARYTVCVALDEAVLNTPWGSESAWPQRTLLSVFHNETAGGEKFFQILDRMKQQPAENLYILELMYIFLSLGFEGKYRVIHRGRDMIEQLRDNLFDIIRRQRGEYERSLSPSWQGLGKTTNSLASYVPMWVVVSVILAILFLSYSGFRLWIFEVSSPVVEELDKITDIRTIARKNPDLKN